MDSLSPLQIAPAETPDSKMRMVIVTGPPEAQFKVLCILHNHTVLVAMYMYNDPFEVFRTFVMHTNTKFVLPQVCHKNTKVLFFGDYIVRLVL